MRYGQKSIFQFSLSKRYFRVSQIRNSNVVKTNFSQTTFLDHADWEKVLLGGPPKIKNWIDNQLEGSTVTCILIGNETNNREWVHYEIRKSIERKNVILGVYIHNVKSISGYTDAIGINPILSHSIGSSPLSRYTPTYDWVNGNGYENFGSWIEAAVNIFRQNGIFRG